MEGMRSQNFELALVFLKSVLMFFCVLVVVFYFRGVNLILYFSIIICYQKDETFCIKTPQR